MSVKAVYLVFFRLEEKKSIEIGALGEIEFEPGIYIYAGSAMNSVEKRIERHFSEVENTHWHIDYFSSVAEAVDYLVVPENSSFECMLADTVSKVGEPVEDFGCSDCNCNAHLLRVD